MKLFLLLVAIVASLHVSQGYILAPLIGYQQGYTLQITPAASTNDQCQTFGTPTPFGYASGTGPIFLYIPSTTGSHTLQFSYDTSRYRLAPFLIPGQTTLQIDASNQQNPLITFDSNRSPVGQSGALYIYLNDVQGNFICFLQIQFTCDSPLTGAPRYGGTFTTGGGGGGVVVPQGAPQGAGTFVVPSGQIFAPVYVQQTVIQQFTTTNTNIQVTNIVNNVNQITNTTVINNQIAAVPPTPPPVNCTAQPTNPACARTPGTNTIVVPSSAGPTSGPPRAGPTVAPVRAPGVAPTTPQILPPATPAGPRPATGAPATGTPQQALPQAVPTAPQTGTAARPAASPASGR